MSTTTIVILVVVGLVVVLAIGWFLVAQARSRRLRGRFGPEYDRNVAEAGNRRAAERELAEREKRHSRLTLRPLPVESRQRYADGWMQVQERFVNEPGPALIEADELVHMAMRECGYPAGDFDQQVADLSVEHARVAGDYRAAHEIRGRHAYATTEELRQALVHHRTVLSELMSAEPEVPSARRPDTSEEQTRVDR